MNGVRSSLEIKSAIADLNDDIKQLRDQIDGLPPSGLTILGGRPVFVCTCSEDAWMTRDSLTQALWQRDFLLGQLAQAEAVEIEAARRRCSVEEVLAMQEGRCTWINDYEDHDTDGPRSMHTILDELGMHIECSPVRLVDLE